MVAGSRNGTRPARHTGLVRARSLPAGSPGRRECPEVCVAEVRCQFRAQHPFHQLDLQLFHKPGVARQVLSALNALQKVIRKVLGEWQACFLSMKHGPDHSYTEHLTLSKGRLNCPFAATRVPIADGHRHRRADGRVQAMPGDQEVWLIGERRATGERKYGERRVGGLRDRRPGSGLRGLGFGVRGLALLSLRPVWLAHRRAVF